MLKILGLEKSTVSVDGARAALLFRLEDGATETVDVATAMLDTLSLQLAEIAAGARAAPLSAATATARQAVTTDVLVGSAVTKVLREGEVTPALRLQLASGLQLTLAMAPGALKSLLAGLLALVRIYESENEGSPPAARN